MSIQNDRPARRPALYAAGLALWLLGAVAQAQSGPSLDESLAVEIEQFVAADHLAPPAPCQVLFVGSSSIVHWKDELAADMAPWPVINRGFGGSYIAHVNRWFAQIVAPYRPRSIVFYAGENDLHAGASVAQVVSDFDAFMALKSQALGSTPVYFLKRTSAAGRRAAST